jgi:uncharacterized protein YbjT (DUF2867 family)
LSVRAVIAGATGLVGSHCLRLLLESPRYNNVASIGRRPLAFAHPKLEEIQSDFGKLPDLPVADIFCAFGTTIKRAGSKEAFRRVDHDYILQLAEWGLRNGAKQFLLVSSVDSDPKSRNFYLQVKGELEADLNALSYESVHIFRPGMLLGSRTENRPLERIGQYAVVALQWALAGKLRKYRGMPADRLAAAMVRTALQQMPGRFVYHYDEI